MQGFAFFNKTSLYAFCNIKSQSTKKLVYRRSAVTSICIFYVGRKEEIYCDLNIFITYRLETTFEKQNLISKIDLGLKIFFLSKTNVVF